jgi:hypothetical protein
VTTRIRVSVVSAGRGDSAPEQECARASDDAADCSSRSPRGSLAGAAPWAGAVLPAHDPGAARRLAASEHVNVNWGERPV